MTDPLGDCVGFDWDDGNETENWDLHRVTPEEAEEISFNVPLIVRSDTGHSGREKRYAALGRTDRSRMLFAAVTVQKKLIRVISIRDMTARERKAYEKHEKDHS